MEEEKIIQQALAAGFYAAAFCDASELVIVPDYRQFCEMNLCHCYGVLPVCPPQCGTVDELTEKVRAHKRALILQTLHESTFLNDPDGARAAKHAHNELADSLVERLGADFAGEILRMSAGPWKTHSCMSAYCVDAQKMADSVQMECWVDDGKTRLFSLILF